jgi:Spy/CpxP family protein refolding chaperone
VKKSLFSIAVLLAAFPAFAAPDFPEGKWWKRPRIAAEIGLSPEQAREIESVFIRSRGKLIDLKAELEKRQGELQDSIEDSSADRDDVAERIEKVEDARAELQKARALMLLDMKQVLRQEQWERLNRLQQEARRALEERRQRFREQEQMERRRMRGQPPDRRDERQRSPERVPKNRPGSSGNRQR